MSRLTMVFLLAVAAAACKTDEAPPPEPQKKIAGPAFEQKLAWILRLEDQRVLRDNAAVVTTTAAPAATARGTGTAPVAAPAPGAADLVQLLADEDARVRRRA